MPLIIKIIYGILFLALAGCGIALIPIGIGLFKDSVDIRRREMEQKRNEAEHTKRYQAYKKERELEIAKWKNLTY